MGLLSATGALVQDATGPANMMQLHSAALLLAIMATNEADRQVGLLLLGVVLHWGPCAHTCDAGKRGTAATAGMGDAVLGNQ